MHAQAHNQSAPLGSPSKSFLYDILTALRKTLSHFMYKFVGTPI